MSTDPFFVDKVRDIVRLYLNPPDNSLVLCVDEKSQCQALERSQPILPMGLGYAEGFTHDYIRHGTTTLFAALNVVTGDVTVSYKARHRHQEFLQFLRLIEANTPAELDFHIIIDNYTTKNSHRQQLRTLPEQLYRREPRHRGTPLPSTTARGDRPRCLNSLEKDAAGDLSDQRMNRVLVQRVT